ncbi:hypothetical protein H4R20_006541, partial [Coemansia guatemalensis]
SIKMTTVGKAVVPFDVNLFGTEGAPFIGLASETAAVVQSAASPATVIPVTATAISAEVDPLTLPPPVAAAATAVVGAEAPVEEASQASPESNEAVPASSSNGVVVETVTFASDNSSPVAAIRSEASANESNIHVASVTVEAVPTPDSAFVGSTSPVLAESVTSVKSHLQQSGNQMRALNPTHTVLSAQDAARALGIVNANEAASKIAHAGMKNKLSESTNAAVSNKQIMSAAIVIPAIAGLLF